MDPQRTTVVSAPGKVLLAGGYLVLEPAYPGLVVATTARFYTVIRNSPIAPSAHASSSKLPSIRVHSPQFVGALWEYNIDVQDGPTAICRLQQTRASYDCKEAGKNPFVELALLYALRLAHEATSATDIQAALGEYGVDVFVVADNDFYSQRKEATGDDTRSRAPTAQELRALPPFSVQSCAIRQVHKTGLGSSAAMTTSLVGALLVHLGVVHACASNTDDPASRSLAIDGNEALALVHNTAQLAHCAAQGKVGSGFDVSAAVWGSQLYRRFDKAAIQAVLDSGESVEVEGIESGKVPSCKMLELAPFLDPRNPLWHPSPLTSSTTDGVEEMPMYANPTAVEGLASAYIEPGNTHLARPAPLELPPYVQMMLADVDAGSNTPSMVGKVMAWRHSKPEWARQMWTVLASANRSLADGLLSLCLAYAQDPVAYGTAIRMAAEGLSCDWEKLLPTAAPDSKPTLSLLIEVRNSMRAISGGMRALGRQADVPVEPDAMGNVIKATIDGAPGVLGGGVPGAGGFDALFILFLQPPSASNLSADKQAQSQIEGVWQDWKALSVGPLLSKAGGAASGSRASADQVRSVLLTRGAPASLPTLPSLNQTEPGGLRVHRLENVAGLSSAIAVSDSRTV